MRPSSILQKLLLLAGLSFVVQVLCTSFSLALQFHLESLVRQHGWLTAPMGESLDLLLQALVGLAFLLTFHRAPPVRELLALRPGVTLGLAASAVALTTLTACVADPNAFLRAPFEPINPLSAPSTYWLGGWLPLTLAALQEELLHRAVWQSLWMSVTGPWVGWLGSAVALAAGPGDFWTALLSDLLLGLVFLRTRSIVCTTALNLALSVSQEVLTRSTLTSAVFIHYDAFERATAIHFASLLTLGVVFELLWRAHHDADSSPDERTERVIRKATAT